MHDLACAIRQLLKAPLVSGAAILSLALALGANTAIFSVFDRLVLRPHTYQEPDSLVRLWTNNPRTNFVGSAVSLIKYEHFRAAQDVFSHFGASLFTGFAFTQDGREPEQVPGMRVARDHFPALGVVPAQGRNFTPEEDRRGAPPVAMVSHEFWQSRLGGRGDALGQAIILNGVAHTVVGILPPELSQPFRNQLVFANGYWLAPGLTESQIQSGATYLQATARLKPGVSLARANEQIAVLPNRYEAEEPARLDAKNPMEMRTLTQELSGGIQQTLRLLLGAVIAVLLIACANVSNLFLSRLSARQKEIAVRLSLGATRWHLIRQFFVESFLFAVISTLLGLALGGIGLVLVQQLAVNQLPPNTVFTLGSATLVFSAGLGILSALAVGCVPAWQASRLGLSEVLKDAARGSSGARGGKIRSMLIVAEVVLAVVLLIGSGLLLLSFQRLQGTFSGLNPSGVAYAVVAAPVERYRTPQQQADFHERVIERIKANPGVQFAGAALGLPLAGLPIAPYTIDGQPIRPISERALVSLQIVTPEFFQALGIALREGRYFTSRDREGSPHVCIINESFARRIFPGQSALGKALRRGRDAEVLCEIVGVVGDVRSNGLGAPPPDVIYYNLLQTGRPGVNHVVRTSGDPAALQGVIRAAVAEVDRNQPIALFNTMETLMSNNTGFAWLVAGLTGTFSGVALLLTAIGLYSVLAYNVAQRTAEIGVRMALGAGRPDIIRMVLRQGMGLVVLGLLLGLGAAAGVARLMDTILFEVEPVSYPVYGAVAVFFAAIAFLACWIPARRAARIDPIIALRAD
jgi:predicted permease